MIFMMGCSTNSYMKTVQQVKIDEFMGKWYVIASRATFLESGAHNAIEDYTWNKDQERIDINFFFNKNSFDGEIKRIPQKAWIFNNETNAHWKVQPFWPLKLDYLVLALDKDYGWTAIGVPNQKYVWIMARDWSMSDEKLNEIISELKSLGYNIENIKRVPQKW